MIRVGAWAWGGGVRLVGRQMVVTGGALFEVGSRVGHCLIDIRCCFYIREVLSSQDSEHSIE